MNEKWFEHGQNYARKRAKEHRPDDGLIYIRNPDAKSERRQFACCDSEVLQYLGTLDNGAEIELQTFGKNERVYFAGIRPKARKYPVLYRRKEKKLYCTEIDDACVPQHLAPTEVEREESTRKVMANVKKEHEKEWGKGSWENAMRKCRAG